MQIQCYLGFDGRTEEAIEYYKNVFGAQVGRLSRFGDAPPSPMMPTDKNKIMHVEIKIGDTTLLASDGNCRGTPNFQGFSLTYNAANEAEAAKIFSALSDGGTVKMPLSKTFFAKSFGEVADRFGIAWMIIAM
jgi:PhnB protein